MIHPWASDSTNRAQYRCRRNNGQYREANSRKQGRAIDRSFIWIRQRALPTRSGSAVAPPAAIPSAAEIIAIAIVEAGVIEQLIELGPRLHPVDQAALRS